MGKIAGIHDLDIPALAVWLYKLYCHIMFGKWKLDAEGMIKAAKRVGCHKVV